MTGMEEELFRTKTPQVRVDGFRRRLRHDLMAAHDGMRRTERRFAAPLAAAAAVVAVLSLAAVLALVARPAYAVRLNALVFRSDAAAPLPVGGGELAVPQVPPLDPVRSARPQEDRPLPRPAAWEAPFESDRRLLQRLAEAGSQGGGAPSASAAALPIEAWDRFTISRIRLTDGSTVQILTELPAERSEPKVVY